MKKIPEKAIRAIPGWLLALEPKTEQSRMLLSLDLEQSLGPAAITDSQGYLDIDKLSKTGKVLHGLPLLIRNEAETDRVRIEDSVP